jgi:hypothetical protein
MPFIYAATMGGISHETFCQWQRKYPDFSESIQRALAKGIAARLKLIKNAAKEDAKLACWWLEHCLPEHFARNRIEHEHSGKIAHEMVVAPETLKAIAESRARYEKSHVDG